MTGDADSPGAVWDEVAHLYGEGWSPFGLFSTKLVEAAAICPGERVVDLGTGNGLGLVPAAVAAAPAIVHGIDFSSDMVAAALRRASDAGVSNVEVRRMDVAALDFPDDSFDVALASSVLQFVAFSPAVLREWCRVLRVGGRLLCSIPRYDSDVTQRLLLQVMREHSSALPEALAGRLQAVGSIEQPDLERLCAASGFTAASVSRIELRSSVPDTEAWWQIQWSHGIRTFLRAFDEQTLAAIKTATTEQVRAGAAQDGSIALELEMELCHATK